MARLRALERGYADGPEEHGLAEAQLTSPMVFVWTMVIFLIIIAFVGAILFRQAHAAFLSNPGLNGLILGVLLIGILMAFSHVLSLRPEVRWFNAFRAVGNAEKVGREPVLLAPMRALIGQRQPTRGISTAALRSILDSIATRLDETRDTSRYLIGLLVFLGLLGTFWGLLGTIGSINTVIQSLDAGSGSTQDVLSALKTGLSAPLTGMGTAFSTSLFGLASSLILGFLDLQAGRAQSRFYTELENWLSSVTDVGADRVVSSTGAVDHDEMRDVSEQLSRLAQDSGVSQRTAAAMANLADGIQGLVKNMRGEQQMLRDWIEAQQEEARAMRSTLEGLINRLPDRSAGAVAPQRPMMPQATVPPAPAQSAAPPVSAAPVAAASTATPAAARQTAAASRTPEAPPAGAPVRRRREPPRDGQGD